MAGGLPYNGSSITVRRYVPHYEPEYAKRGWRTLSAIDRVYVNGRRKSFWRYFLISANWLRAFVDNGSVTVQAGREQDHARVRRSSHTLRHYAKLRPHAPVFLAQKSECHGIDSHFMRMRKVCGVNSLAIDGVIA
ncbi:hypothetical protein EC912_105219 [Luteibacter rhizovicinus]|uniref:Uncharacterized protein n=1 Tax=Luteibacter rhizovicinus TaxID=242606 RepID=A0A4V2W3U9_9GAMM|nr:hypothetical protein EC912_105219 [Luteibacter rhizovicinus]